MPHLVLLGDSIFDNAHYAPGGPAVLEHVQRSLPGNWTATLLALDGATTDDIPRQVAALPADATHLVLSVGGNDGLGEMSLLDERTKTVKDGLLVLNEVCVRFAENYRRVLAAVVGTGKPMAVCTIYDSIPGLDTASRTALRGLNEIILREAFAARLPVIDLRLICTEPGDYSHVSPIEPSVAGGAKIGYRIAVCLTAHNFAARQSAVYW